MKSPPKGWPRISSSVFYEDPRKAIDWLCRAFGFEVRIIVDGPNGCVEHSELTFGEGVVMVSSAGGRNEWGASPNQLEGRSTQSIFAYVDDIEAHYQRAKAAGAQLYRELATTDYGAEHWADRGYSAIDPEGHRWSFAQRVRS